MEIIAAEGAEKLSLREVARRLKVSHQAPYKHFPSRDHLMAELISRCFIDFASALRRAAAAEDEPGPSLIAMGEGYLAFAREHPFAYRLMFASPLPSREDHPEMAEHAAAAFRTLREGVLRLHRHNGRPDPETLAEQDALHIWATMHGLATILRHDAIQVVGLSEDLLAQAPLHTFARLAVGLMPPGQPPTAPIFQDFDF